jgi:hypothetical protein
LPLSTYSGWWFQTFFICSFHIWDVILPIDELIFFKMVGIPPTSYILFCQLPIDTAGFLDMEIDRFLVALALLGGSGSFAPTAWRATSTMRGSTSTPS